MITSKEINEMIESIRTQRKSYRSGQESLGLTTSAENKIRFLRECRMYLDTNPSESYLTSWLNTATKTVNSIESRSGQRLGSNPHMMMKKNWRSTFEAETGIKDLKKRIKTVNFIINGK